MRNCFRILVIISCFTACKDAAFVPKQTNYAYSLVRDTTILVPLDTTQSFYVQFMQYDDKLNRMYMFNSFNNTIYTYDYPSRKLIRKDSLQKEGPDGVGAMYGMGFYIKNDTTYLLNYKESKLIKMVKDKVVSRIDLSFKVFETDGIPEASLYNPMILDSPYMQIITQSIDPREDNTRLTSQITVDLRTDSFTRSIRRPALYNSGYWGLMNLYRVSHAFNPETRENVFCYPASSELFIYKDTTLVKKVQIESDYFSNEKLKPIKGVTAKEGINYINTHRKKAQAFDLTHSHYGQILFDKFKKQYYIITNIGMTEDEYDDPDKFRKYPNKHSVIVLNEKFEKLTEYLFDRHGYFFGAVIVTKDGLLVANKNMYNFDENFLPLTAFTIKKK